VFAEAKELSLPKNVGKHVGYEKALRHRVDSENDLQLLGKFGSEAKGVTNVGANSSSRRESSPVATQSRHLSTGLLKGEGKAEVSKFKDR